MIGDDHAPFPDRAPAPDQLQPEQRDMTSRPKPFDEKMRAQPARAEPVNRPQKKKEQQQNNCNQEGRAKAQPGQNLRGLSRRR